MTNITSFKTHDIPWDSFYDQPILQLRNQKHRDVSHVQTVVLTFSILFPNIARDPQSFSDWAGLTEFSLLSPFMSKLLEGAFNRALDILPPRGIPSSPQDGPGRGPGVRALFFPSAS